MGFPEKATEAITSWHKKQSGDPEEKSIVNCESREKSKNEGNSMCRNALSAFTPCRMFLGTMSLENHSMTSMGALVSGW
jgi:hypothetical protein